MNQRIAKLSIITTTLLLGSGCALSGGLHAGANLSARADSRANIAPELRGLDGLNWSPVEHQRFERASSRGLVVVSTRSGRPELLTSCEVAGSYAFRPTSLRSDSVSLSSRTDASVTLPLLLARYGGNLSSGHSQHVSYAMAGEYSCGRRSVPANELRGFCDGATHVIASWTAGALELRESVLSGHGALGASTGGIDAGLSQQETGLRQTVLGSPAACAQVSAGSASAPADCRSALDFVLAPITAPECAHNERWDGRACVAAAPAPTATPTAQPPRNDVPTWSRQCAAGDASACNQLRAMCARGDVLACGEAAGATLSGWLPGMVGRR